MTVQPIPGPYTKSGRHICDDVGAPFATIHGNAGVPVLDATAHLLKASWGLLEFARNVMDESGYEVPGGGKNCRFCDNSMDHRGSFKDMHAKGCLIHSARAVIAQAEGREP